MTSSGLGPFKVLHVIPSVAPFRGGPSFAIRTIAGGLAKQGMETHVATTDDNGHSRLPVSTTQPSVENGVIYRYFRRQTRFYICSLPFSRWLWRHATEYDVIHIHTVFSYCSNVAAWMAHRKAVPYIIRPLGVLNRWGFQNRRPVVKRLSFAVIEKRLLSRAAAVQYTTQQEREEAAGLGFAHNAVVIPNPVELTERNTVPHGQFRARYPHLADRRMILFLSRIDAKKGLDLLFPAFRQVLREDPRAVLIIAGDGDASIMQQLRRLSSEWGIEDSVLWPGFLSGREKLAALADADVFVLPSYSENFGMAPVEAMGLGLPVVVTDQVGIHREIAQERAGMVTPVSVPALASALLLLLRDEKLRSEMGRNALRLTTSQYSVEAVTSRLIDLYTKVCPRPLSPAMHR